MNLEHHVRGQVPEHAHAEAAAGILEPLHGAVRVGVSGDHQALADAINALVVV